MNVKKSVRTEREVVRVPRRREEVVIERVPVEGEAREASGATEADIGEDEVVVQVLCKEEVEIGRPHRERRRRCPARAPGQAPPAREED